jgi:Na+/phosphate symporter
MQSSQRNRSFDDPGSDQIRERARELANQLSELMQYAQTHVEEQHAHAQGCRDIEEMQRLTDADPFRWLDDAKRSLQQGLMFLDRAMSQPRDF